MSTAKFENIGECVPANQLLATGMESLANYGYAKFGAGTFKRGMLVTIKGGIATKYDSDDKIVDVTYTAAGDGETDPTIVAQKNRFAIVNDDFVVAGTVTAGNEELHVVFTTGSFYKDTVEAVTAETVTLEHELEMNAEGIFLNNTHL